MRSRGRIYKRRSEAMKYLLSEGWRQSANDKTHFRNELHKLQCRVLKSKHNQWFISIVS